MVELEVYHSDTFGYHLYARGVLEDEYDSDPIYWEDFLERESDTEADRIAWRERVRGNPFAVLPFCLPGTTHWEITGILWWGWRPVFEEERQSRFVGLFGIPEERCSRTFGDIQADRCALAVTLLEPHPGISARRKNGTHLPLYPVALRDKEEGYPMARC